MIFYITLFLIVSFIFFLAWLILSPRFKYHSFLYRVKAGIIFFFGALRLTKQPLWITTAPQESWSIPMSEIRKGDAICQPGDIGLSRHEWVASNLGIPGAFKHAWIITEDKTCVEAKAAGVLKNDRMDPMMADAVIILRPKHVSCRDIALAIRRANGIVGCEYDANFNFNFEEEDGAMARRFARNISSGAFHPAFSCTETVGFAYYKNKDMLRLFRTMQAGREAIVADDYLRMEFDIVWASDKVTVKWAEKLKLHEEGRRKIAAYRAMFAENK